MINADRTQNISQNNIKKEKKDANIIATITMLMRTY